MPIELSPTGLEFVEEQIALGRFRTANDVVDAALMALREREQRDDEKIRALLAVAIDEADRGQTQVFDPERIKRLGRERLAEGRGA